MSGTLYKGTTFCQDSRFKNKEKKLIESKTYPKEYDTKIFLEKIELKVIKDWVEKNINKILGFEDEFLVNFVMNLLENPSEDPRKIELQLKGFLADSTEKFMKDLWCLLIQAQISENGIPEVLLKEKEEELKAKSEKNLEKVKFLEKMLGEKEIKFEKESNKIAQDKPESEKIEGNKEENKDKKEQNEKEKIEVKYSRHETKEKSYYKDDKRREDKRSDYHHSSRRRSHSDDRRSRSRNKDKRRNDKYKKDSHRNSYHDDRQKSRDRNYKR